MPIRLNAAQFQEKHARRLKGATEDIRRGIERVTDAPSARAIAKKDKFRNNLLAAIDGGKWEAGLARVDLNMWKAAALNKGISRIGVGIDAAKDKVTQFAEQLLQYEGSLQNRIESMPDITLDDNIARMTAWARGMSEFERKQ